MKPRSEFVKRDASADGLNYSCASCRRDQKFRIRLKNCFGLTIAEYEALAANGCHICGGRNPHRRLNVDHCHETKVVRGVLCDKCNMAIGHLRDSPELLRRAATYIEKARSRA